MEKGANLNRSRRSNDNSAFLSIEGCARRETTATMNIRLTVMDSPFLWGLKFSKSMMKQSNDSMIKGGVGVMASMIVLTPELEAITPIACVAVHVSDDYYATMDSGTNAVIVRLHPDMSGEIAERKAPSATIQGPIAQTSWRAKTSSCPSSISDSYLSGVANHCCLTDSHC